MFKNILLFIVLNCCVTQQVFAIGMTIPEKQLNAIVNLRFPLSHTYLDYTLKASQPSISLFSDTQSVAISALIEVKNKKNKLLANTTFKGQVTFDKASKALKVTNPLITQFSVIENSFSQTETPVNSIENIVGQHLPISVLIDFNKIDSELFLFVPSKLTIVQGGLKVEY